MQTNVYGKSVSKALETSPLSTVLFPIFKDIKNAVLSTKILLKVTLILWKDFTDQ